MRLGVVGLGRMGLPIARNLLSAGFDVSVHDSVDERMLAAAPARAVSDAVALAASVDVFITVLPGAPEVEKFMTAEVIAALDGVWLDLTSNDPRVAERIVALGVEAVGAPMGGGVAAAETGSLHFFVGGTAVDRVRPVLDALGTIEEIGPAIGAGYTAKLLANLLWFGQAVAVTEALLLGQALGLPPGPLSRTLAASAAGSVFIDEYLGRLLDGDYLETFGIDRCVEELDTLASLAVGEGVPFELSSLVARQYHDALERFGAVPGELLAAKLLEERAGRTLRRRECRQEV